MFAVLFEVHPARDRWDDYRSLTRNGWILSLSTWRDEKALVRWRTRAKHHDVQAEGRAEILHDYHLRVGQITDDTDPPAGHELREQRLDETEVGATAISLATGRRPHDEVSPATAHDIAAWLGLDSRGDGLVSWDVYDAVLQPGDVILMTSWTDQRAARARNGLAAPAGRIHSRQVRVIRDYGMTDRHEAPQYYPPAPATTVRP